MQADYNADVLAYGSQCIAYWPLTEASGTSFADSKGSNNGSVATSPTRVTGPDGTATGVDVAATANKVVIPGSQVAWPESYSVCFWARMNSVPASDAMAFEWNQSAFSKYVQFDAGYTGAITTFTTGARSFMSTYYGTAAGAQAAHHADTDFGTATWKFVTVTFDASQGSTAGAQKVYIDGTLVSVTTSLTLYDQPDGAPGSGYLGIGGRNNAGTRQLPLDGALNGFAVLATVLNSTQINTLRLSMLATAKSASDSFSVSDSASVSTTTATSASDTATVSESAVAAVALPDPGAGVTQTFTGTDGTTLSTFDSRWVAHPAFGGDVAKIYSNQVEPNGAGAATGYIFNVAPPTPDYGVSCDFNYVARANSPFTHAGVMVRMDATATTWYQAFVEDGDLTGQGYISLYKYVAGTATPLGTYNAGLTVGNTYTLRLEAIGSSIVVKLNGTARISVTDTSITAAGYGGLRLGPAHATAGTHDKGFRADNWHLDSLAAGYPDTITVSDSASASAPPIEVSASDTVSVTDSASRADGTVALTASDTFTATDTRAGLLAKIDPRPGGVTAPTVSGSRTTITSSSDDPSHTFNYAPGYIITDSGARVITYQHSFMETFNAAYGGGAGDGHNGVRVERVAPGADPTNAANWGYITDLDHNRVGGGGCGDVNLSYVSSWQGNGVKTLVATWTHVTPLTSEAAMVLYNRYSISIDDGLTWSAPADLSDLVGFPQPGHYVATDGYYELMAAQIIELANGDLQLVTYKKTTTGFTDYEFVAQTYKSTNHGTSWGSAVTVFPYVAHQGHDEPYMVQLPSTHPTHPGRVVCLSRVYENIHGTSGSPATFLHAYWESHSDDNCVTWSAPQRVMGPGSSQTANATYWGCGNSPRMTVLPSGMLIILSRMHKWTGTAYVAAGPGYAVSADGITWSDWYDARTGSTFDFTYPGADRDPSMHGQFRVDSTGALDLVYGNYTAYGSGPVQIHYQKFVGAALITGQGQEAFAVADGAAVTVGVGAITKTASDGFNVTDTSSVAVTYRKSASDVFTVSDSSGTSTTTDPVKYVTPCTANFVSASGHTANFVSASGHTARFVSSPAVTT